MALATEDDVEAALGRPLTSTEDVTTLLEQASDRVIAYLGGTPDPIPEPVARVVAIIVVAVLTKPAVTTADYSAGGYNTQREVTTVAIGGQSSTTTGPWLTRELRATLHPYRMQAAQTAYTISLIDGGDDE